MPMMGAPFRMARSITLHIFSAATSESEPPKTVKSWGVDVRGAAGDLPVAGDDGSRRGTSCPTRRNSLERWVTNEPSSSNEPGSTRSSMRSRAVSLPRACCCSARASPPPTN